MIIAQRYILAPGPDGKVTSYLPGDVIPGFHEWSELAQRAHLNQRLVVEKPDPEMARVSEAFEAQQLAAMPVAAPQAADPSPMASPPAYVCEPCLRQFDTAKGLNAHNRRMHMEAEPRA